MVYMRYICSTCNMLLCGIESHELEMLNVKENADAIVHLPLSRHHEWLPNVRKILDPSKPTICLVCKYNSTYCMLIMGVYSAELEREACNC